MHLDTEPSQRLFRIGVVARHQKFMVERDFGDNHTRHRQQLPTSQTQDAQRCFFVGEYFEF